MENNNQNNQQKKNNNKKRHNRRFNKHKPKNNATTVQELESAEALEEIVNDPLENDGENYGADDGAEGDQKEGLTKFLFHGDHISLSKSFEFARRGL